MDIKIDDPDTVAIIHDYTRYLQQVDEIESSVDQAAESMLLGFIDEHVQFRSWRRMQDHAKL